MPGVSAVLPINLAIDLPNYMLELLIGTRESESTSKDSPDSSKRAPEQSEILLKYSQILMRSQFYRQLAFVI